MLLIQAVAKPEVRRLFIPEEATSADPFAEGFDAEDLEWLEHLPTDFRVVPYTTRHPWR
ncbi:hypothetical protein [Thioalkalivibrio sp.]|uniref:hypothetical protein n=1 Tax=Thioalkalivibrio sp. TaxID=2093813 RepID=UPI0039747B9A